MHDRTRIIEALRSAMPTLRTRYGVAGLALFGSVARGDANAESDVDLLVDFEPTAAPTLFSLAGLKDELEQLLGTRVDLVLHRALRPAMKQQVEREAMRVA